MTNVRVVTQPGSARVYVFGRRLHHGLFGIALSIVGLALAVHDRRDWPFLHDTP
jgi:hypothetical protein